MPFTARLHRHRPLLAAATALCLTGASGALLTAPAQASTKQISIVEPGPSVNSNPTGTMQTLRLLGVNEIRLNLPWNVIAPDASSFKAPKHFSAASPSAYQQSRFATYDSIIEAAHADGIGVDLDLSGKAPQWAMPGHQKLTAQGSYYPSAKDYGAFYVAVAKRYSGTYTPPGASAPLPDVTFWSVWNEPDYTASLKPQSTGKHNPVPASPAIYRGLVNAASKALRSTGHRHDKLVIGELTPRGYPKIKYGGMYPLVFVQSLYCLSARYRPLKGSAATEQGCSASGSTRRFRSQNPGLFAISGLSLHPYSRWYPPNTEKYFTCKSGLCASMGDVGNLVRAINKVERAYGSNKKIPIYSTEYGYQTSPPKLSYDPSSKGYNISPTTAALYINWAEYISYKNPQIASYDQYLLQDPQKPTKQNDYGSYASGLLTWDGLQKPTYDAFRLPLFLPKTTASSGHGLEVWGGVRPAPFATLDTGGTQPTVNIEFEPSGSSTFTTIDPVTISNHEGYFDTRVTFPGSGTVMLSYAYPASDMMLDPGVTVDSRPVSITVN